jgi:Ca2+-binding EF-hand superfamily protein
VTIAFVALSGLRLCRVPTNKKGYLQNAKQQIRDKIEGRIASGPSGLRRAFQFFDRDGGGTIDLDEFKVGLEKYCGLKFTDTFVEELMNEFDDGSGSITYHSFCELVMGSKSTDATGFVAPTPKAPPSPSTRQSLFTLEPPEVAAPPVMDATGIDRTDIAGIKNFIIERVEAKNANLSAVFRKFDEDKSGNLSYPEFRKGLLALGSKYNAQLVSQVCQVCSLNCVDVGLSPAQSRGVRHFD